MGFIAVTHYKKTSERFPGKHHTEFADGKTLVDIKIEQYLAAGAEHVYISTDDPNVKNTEHVTYIKRDSSFCNNKIEFSYVLEEVYNSVPVSDEQHVIYSLVCCPLFNRYAELYETYKTTGRNQLAVQPSVHYWLGANKKPVNFQFGLWMSYSQSIDPIYLYPYAGTATTMGELRKVKFMIPQQYDYFHINQFESVDIDTREDFEFAQKLYEK